MLIIKAINLDVAAILDAFPSEYQNLTKHYKENVKDEDKLKIRRKLRSAYGEDREQVSSESSSQNHQSDTF